MAVIAASLVAAVALGAAAFGSGSAASASGPTASAPGSGSAGPTAPAPGSGSAKGHLASSASDSASASSVEFTVSATETTPTTTSTMVTGSGAFDLAKGVGEITASVPGLSSPTGTGSPGSVHIISDGANLYVDVPGLSSVTGGKTWVETSASGLASLAGSTAGSLPVSALTDPSRAMGLLGSLGGSVTRVGTVQLHGEPTTEYRTTLSVADVVAKATRGSDSSAASAAVKAIRALGVPSVPVTAWVGPDGLLRQVSATVDLSHASLAGVLGSLAPASGGSPAAGTSLDLTVGLSHYGQPVTVTVPPASEIVRADSIGSSLKGMASALGGTLSTIASHL